MRAATGTAHSHHQEEGQHDQSEEDDRFHRLTLLKRRVYGTTVILLNVAVFRVLELPEATTRPT